MLIETINHLRASADGMVQGKRKVVASASLFSYSQGVCQDVMIRSCMFLHIIITDVRKLSYIFFIL
jgi:hypothetical protein